MTEEVADKKPDTGFTITVNKKKVPVTEHKMTGLEIKQAAIDAHVEIEPSFQLAEIKEKKRKIIGDNEAIHVDENSRFVATSGDDNS